MPLVYVVERDEQLREDHRDAERHEAEVVALHPQRRQREQEAERERGADQPSMPATKVAPCRPDAMPTV